MLEDTDEGQCIRKDSITVDEKKYRAKRPPLLRFYHQLFKVIEDDKRGQVVFPGVVQQLRLCRSPLDLSGWVLVVSGPLASSTRLGANLF